METVDRLDIKNEIVHKFEINSNRSMIKLRLKKKRSKGEIALRKKIRDQINSTISRKEKEIIERLKKKAEKGQKEAIRKLIWVSLIGFLFLSGEFVGGYISNSTAIMSDAAHMLSDFLGFGISMISILISRRQPTNSLSYGYHRAEIVGAMVSVVLIWGLTAWLVHEAIDKIIKEDKNLNATVMLITAGVGLLCNILMGHILHSSGGNDNGSFRNSLSNKVHEEKEKKNSKKSKKKVEPLLTKNELTDPLIHDHSELEKTIGNINSDRNDDSILHIKDKNEENKIKDKHDKHHHEHKHAKKETQTHNHNQNTHSDHKGESNYEHNHSDNHNNLHEHEKQTHEEHEKYTHNQHENQSLNEHHKHSHDEYEKHRHHEHHDEKKSKTANSKNNQFNIGINNHENHSHDSHKHDHSDHCNHHENHHDSNEHDHSDHYHHNENHHEQESHHNNSQELDNMNIKAAMIHVIGDIIQSIGVLIAAIVLYFYPNYWFIDPICTFTFSVMVLITTVPIMKECIKVIMEATPNNIDIVKLTSDLMQIYGVLQVHDLHVWTLKAGVYSLSCHIESEDPMLSLKRATRMLNTKYRILHTTIQVEDSNNTDIEFDCKPHH